MFTIKQNNHGKHRIVISYDLLNVYTGAILEIKLRAGALAELCNLKLFIRQPLQKLLERTLLLCFVQNLAKTSCKIGLETMINDKSQSFWYMQ